MILSLQDDYPCVWKGMGDRLGVGLHVVGAVPAADQEDGNGDLRQAPELDRSADLGRELARDGVDGRDATPPRGLGPERSDLLIGEHHHLPEQDVEGRLAIASASPTSIRSTTPAGNSPAAACVEGS